MKILPCPLSTTHVFYRPSTEKARHKPLKEKNDGFSHLLKVFPFFPISLPPPLWGTDPLSSLLWPQNFLSSLVLDPVPCSRSRLGKCPSGALGPIQWNKTALNEKVHLTKGRFQGWAVTQGWPAQQVLPGLAGLSSDPHSCSSSAAVCTSGKCLPFWESQFVSL